MHELLKEDEDQDRALLIGIDYADGQAEKSIDELERLCDTAHIITVAKVLQRREKMDTATYIGAGKAEELAEFCETNEINLAVTDEELKGSQVRELEELLGVRVIDRTTLILDIFASRARSVEGKLQVELAQYQYRLPRLLGYGKALSRLGGGIGTRGPGETKLETDRRHIKRRISYLTQQLQQVSARRAQLRKKRKKDQVPTVALVGYTNAGKSSLMNALCENADVYAQDQLFATLDPTIRKMQTDENSVVLLVDTVGFIRKLPHDLINAFRSTLEESVEADLILHVIDVSDEDCESQIKTVDQILESLGVADKPVFKIFNKCDVPDCSPVLQNSVFLSEKLKNPHCYFTSAKTGQGLPELKQNILKQVIQVQQHTLFIPYTHASLLDVLHRTCKILSEEYTENGTILKALLDEENRNRFSEFIKDE